MPPTATAPPRRGERAPRKAKSKEDDAKLLRELWRPEILGEYEGEWIAFHGSVLRHGRDLGEVSEPFLEQIAKGEGPLFAFVTFQILT
jgi:hypothetical protein